jgi:hypothetical protein
LLFRVLTRRMNRETCLEELRRYMGVLGMKKQNNRPIEGYH